MRRLSAVLLILFCLAATSAAPDDLSKKFLGAWRLVSIEGSQPGLPNNFDRPTGIIIYAPSGHMSVNIARKADRKPFAPYNVGVAAATTEEKAAAFDSYSAYYGTFTIDAKAGTVTHHMQGNLIPGRQGTDNVRWFDFQGPDRLLLTPVEDGKGGTLARKDATYRLLWERLK